MATASHAAGFQLRQTAGAMQTLVPATGLKGFERYRLLRTVTPRSRDRFAEAFRNGVSCRHAEGRPAQR